MTLKINEKINDEFDDDEEEIGEVQAVGIFVQADILLRQFRDLFANSPWTRFDPAAHDLDRNCPLPEHANWPELCQHIVWRMSQPDCCESEFARGLHIFRLAGIHWYQSEHVFCYPKDLPTEGELAYFSPSELGKWRKPYAYEFRRFRQQAKKHRWDIPNGPKGTRMICRELLRRKNAVEEGFRQIAAIRRTIADNCQMELNVSGSIGYDLFTDQFHRKSRASHHLAQDIARRNYFASTILGCDLGVPMDDYCPPTFKEIEEEGRELAKNEPNRLLLRNNPLRNLVFMNFYGTSTVFFAQKNGKLLPDQDFKWPAYTMRYARLRRPPRRGDYNVTVGYRALRDFLFPPRERSPEAVVSAMAAALKASDARTSRREGVRLDLELQFPPTPPALPAKQKSEGNWNLWVEEITSSMPSFSLRRKRKNADESRRPLFAEPSAPDAPVRAATPPPKTLKP